jgi:ABC-type glycerol-3-phosphate transport system substrate-binding protein
MAKNLTKRDPSTGEITQAGLAVGTSENVLHSESILIYFFLLNGLDNEDLMTSSTEANITGTKAEVALRTYASFTDSETGTWSTSLKTDLELFYEGKLAFMFAPSWRAFDIIEAAPSIEFGIAKTPQLLGNSNVYFSMYWGEAVSKYCENPGLAWDFINYLNTESVQKKLYSNSSSVRAFGEPYSLKSLSSLLYSADDNEEKDLEDENYPSAIIEMAPSMRAWRMGDQYFVENKLNEAITSVIEDGTDPSMALEDAQAEINDQLAESNK